jgi:hypothetical protein
MLFALQVDNKGYNTYPLTWGGPSVQITSPYTNC